MAKEQQIRERIERGEYIFDMLKLGDVLKGLGVVEKRGHRLPRKDMSDP